MKSGAGSWVTWLGLRAHYTSEELEDMARLKKTETREALEALHTLKALLDARLQ